jgi:hypothetical protein
VAGAHTTLAVTASNIDSAARKTKRRNQLPFIDYLPKPNYY